MSQNKRKRNHKCLKSMGDFNLVREPQANMSLYLKVQTRRDDRKRNESNCGIYKVLIKKLKEKEQRKKLKSANTVR